MSSGVRPADKTSTEPGYFMDYPHLPAKDENGKPNLNRWSHFMTRNHDFPAAKAMLYAAGVPDENAMANWPHVGVASVWWEGNPCNMHLLDLGKTVKDAVMKRDMLAWQYNTIGVSDGITMGSEGRCEETISLALAKLIRHALFSTIAGNHCRQH